MKLADIRLNPAKLREARGERTVRQVASLVGVSPQHISMIERGLSQPSADVLLRLCRLYQIDLSDLVIEERRRSKSLRSY